MINNSLFSSADSDFEARNALWRSIIQAIENVRLRYEIKSIKIGDNKSDFTSSKVPDVPTWRLIEALCLLGVILRSEAASSDKIHIFNKSGPIEIVEDGVVRFLWSQHTLIGEKSSLKGRPDLIVTSNSKAPNPSNALRIIEAKCIKHLGINIIRSEFGKAYDLRISSYLIWSFYSPIPNVIAGAKGLGIDLQTLGFDTDRRNDLISSSEVLISHIINSQEQVRKAQVFAKALSKASDEARNKLLTRFN